MARVKNLFPAPQKRLPMGKELWGRRGMLCRVLEGGISRTGDSIEQLR